MSRHGGSARGRQADAQFYGSDANLCSPESPSDAFAAVPYRNEWYWIDDKNFRSNLLFTLTETGDKHGAPVITLPAG